MKKHSDSTTTIQELKDLVEKFTRDRNWQRHHSSKNISMAIAVEAAELMEHYQWERDGKPDAVEIADELSDIILNCLNFAINNGIDISSAFAHKYKKLQKKYPVKTFNANNDSLENYNRVRKNYRNKK